MAETLETMAGWEECNAVDVEGEFYKKLKYATDAILEYFKDKTTIYSGFRLDTEPLKNPSRNQIALITINDKPYALGIREDISGETNQRTHYNVCIYYTGEEPTQLKAQINDIVGRAFMSYEERHTTRT